MKNKIFLFGFTIFISVLAASCGGNKNGFPKFPPAQVTAFKVQEGKASYYDNYPATVTALNQVELRPEVSGYITGIYFQDGQHVTNGMKLYTIEQQQYKGAYEQAVANLNAAKANLAKAQQDYDRYAALEKNDAIAKQILEHAQADLQASKMQVAAAEANVNLVQTNLQNSVIYAPFDGTIGISQVKLGSAVTTGQTLLNTISSDNPVAVDFSVDEKQIERFTELLHRKIIGKDSTFTIIMPDQTIYPYAGRLVLLDRAVNPETGTIIARLEFPNTKNLLRPGLTCDVRVLSNNAANSILIPYKAVVVQMGEYFVFVVKGNKVSQQKVDLGMQINDLVVVKDGLKPGEEIVSDGVQKLRDNSPIILASSGAKLVSQK